MVKYIYMNYIQCLIIFLWNSKEMNDMYNENDVNTAFLNNAIGRLFNKEDYNIEKNRALISNMDDTKKELLKETRSNAVKKYEYKVG